MHVWHQALILRDRGKKLTQHVALHGVKRGGHLALVSTRQLGKPAHQLLSSRSKEKRMQSAIARVAASLNIATILEFIDVGHNTTGEQTKLNA
jgi:hypothetical protein